MKHGSRPFIALARLAVADTGALRPDPLPHVPEPRLELLADLAGMRAGDRNGLADRAAARERNRKSLRRLIEFLARFSAQRS